MADAHRHGDRCIARAPGRSAALQAEVDRLSGADHGGTATGMPLIDISAITREAPLTSRSSPFCSVVRDRTPPQPASLELAFRRIFCGRHERR